MRITLSVLLMTLALFAISHPAHAAATGTAWGVQTGTVSCGYYQTGSTSEHRCFLSLAYSGWPLTVVTCTPPYDTWCAGIVSGKTVILSFDERALLSGDVVTINKVPNGSTLTTY